MKLSKETLSILKNYASINSNLLLKGGNTISTISAQKNIVASSKVAETLPEEFGIYDLNEFLGVMSLFTDADLSFSDKFVTIKEGKAHVKYYAADKSVLTHPSKEIVFPQSDIEFDLSSATLSQIIRTASVLRAPDLSIVGDGSKVSLVVGDRKNQTANTFDIDVGNSASTFNVALKVDNLKMLPGDYRVSLSSKKISRFQSTNSDSVYYVAVEADSTFDEASV